MRQFRPGITHASPEVGLFSCQRAREVTAPPPGARHLGVVEEIISRSPSPNTYGLPVTDNEFHFCLDYSLLDLLLYAHEHKVPAASVATSLQLSETQIQRVFRDFAAKGMNGEAR
jgi:NH3-dependent NAD+ synthetase